MGQTAEVELTDEATLPRFINEFQNTTSQNLIRPWSSCRSCLAICLRAGIRLLNERNSEGGRRPFYLFHRACRWNEIERTCMGWERKRSKLVEFNCLLHGDKILMQ